VHGLDQAVVRLALRGLQGVVVGEAVAEGEVDIPGVPAVGIVVQDREAGGLVVAVVTCRARC